MCSIPKQAVVGALQEVTWNAKRTRAGMWRSCVPIERRRPSLCPADEDSKKELAVQRETTTPFWWALLVMIKVGGQGLGGEKGHTCEGKGKGLIRLDCRIAAAFTPPQPVPSARPGLYPSPSLVMLLFPRSDGR